MASKTFGRTSSCFDRLFRFRPFDILKNNTFFLAYKATKDHPINKKKPFVKALDPVVLKLLKQITLFLLKRDMIDFLETFLKQF